MFIHIIYDVTMFLFHITLEMTFHVFLQRHDIIKKRIDAHGNVIETRADTIGSPKVSQIN